MVPVSGRSFMKRAMQSCPPSQSERGDRQCFFPNMPTATVTPHTEMMNDLLKLAVESGVSDVIIKSNKPGYVRMAGKLKPVDMDPITCPEAEAWVVEHVPRIFKIRWDEEGQVDFAYAAEGIGRFRVNAFHQRGLVSIVFRHIKSTVPNFDQLNLGVTA